MTGGSGMTRLRLRRIEQQGSREVDDVVAVEEPLEIRLRYQRQGQVIERALSITMRTPGQDEELAVGFLAGEGLLRQPADLLNVQATPEAPGRVTVELRHGAEAEIARLQRNFYATSSCGVCGRASLEAIDLLATAGAAAAGASRSFQLDAELLRRLPERLRAAQSAFAASGGVHAAGLFSRSGELLGLREDVGRHNALDKLIGARFLAGEWPLAESILLLSGRASFELLQKAVMAGIPVIAAVGAPSSLAVELARRHQRTLIGFLRGERFNLYCGAVSVSEE